MGPTTKSQALALMRLNDASGSRLWALLSQPALPEAVERWIWPATQKMLAASIGDTLDAFSATPVQLWHAIKEHARPDLRGRDNEARRRGETWLRIGLLWLLRKRGFDPLLAMEDGHELLFRDPEKDARRITARSIQRGKPAEFRLVAALVAMMRATLGSLRRERDEARQQAGGLRQQLDDASTTITQTQAKIADLEARVEELTKELDETKRSAEADRRGLGQQIDGLKAAQRVLLRERMAPLLSDAIDALEIERPALTVALRRAKNVLSIIEENTK